ncbi:MAG: SUMF1/EgtB/PvdO family nonheme iron enzyme, partial [Nitrospirae bacterium]|nr:SUMF1/EgtB/PvdO family nonheme iron enzyme [Nitrospirota bacterium]
RAVWAAVAALVLLLAGGGYWFWSQNRQNIERERQAWVEAAVPSDMVLVPAGEFWMGCNESVDNECGNDERPYHKVYLDAFSIDKTEVTVDAYRKCVNAGACAGEHNEYRYVDRSLGDLSRFCNYGHPDGRGNHPMNCVTWEGDRKYCAWAGKRLPTEAEWEKAARGGDGRKYPWGNAQASCRYAVMWDGGNGCGETRTWPVGSKAEGASPYGALDMAGNVDEWVSDWYGETYYSGSPSRNPKGSSSGQYRRVVRGGDWGSLTEYVRSSFRINSVPSGRHAQYGFRCARTGS